MHIYDYIIIGSGLTGQTIATTLSQETQNVLLLEAENVLGGSNRQAQIANHITNAGLRFLPANELSEKALRFVENILNLKLVKNIIPNQPQTYDSSGFKDFLGFGDKSPEFYDQLAYFLSSKEIELHLPVHQIVQLLKEKYLGETILRAHVTQLATENDLTHVVVNGSKSYYAKKFIYTGSVKDLAQIISDDILPIRAKAKLKKDTYWMAVCLDFYHENHLENKENLFILDSTTDDGLGPCIGRFQSGISSEISDLQKNQQISQWMSFIDFNTAEETENIGEVLKKMKRQIKRAFPEAYEAVKAERIFMSPPLTGGELKLNANGTLHKTNNFWIASAQMSESPNLLGSLLQAQMTLAALGVSLNEQVSSDDVHRSSQAIHQEISQDIPSENLAI